MKVRDVMSTPPRVCRPGTDLGDVTMIMWNHDCGFVPVVDESGSVAGVLTDRDICIAAATRRRLPQEITAAEAMSTEVLACSPNDDVSEALARMKQFRVRRLPVIEAGGHLQGVVSMNDVVLAAEQRRKPSAREVVSTMAAICAHRTAEAART